MPAARPTFFGKYRGTVANDIDLQGIGRVQVSVPDVLGDGSMAWAMPCSPYAGDGIGFFAIPPVGANVWVEFERGDPEYPIWSGGFWDLGKTPSLPGPLGVFKTVLKTDKFLLEADNNPALPTLTLSMDIGGVTGTVSLVADMTGLTITAAGNTITMAVDGATINNPALKIMK